MEGCGQQGVATGGEADVNGALWRSVSLCSRSGSGTQAKGIWEIRQPVAVSSKDNICLDIANSTVTLTHT